MSTSIRPVPNNKNGRKRQARTSSPRVAVQRTAPKTIGRHVSRTLFRVAVLLVADISAFALIHWIAAQMLIWEAMSSFTQFLRGPVDGGFLGGWQFAVALIVGLAATGSYSKGEAWRDVGRIGRGVILATALVLWRLVWVQGVFLVAIQFAVAVTIISAVVISERNIVENLMFRFWPKARREKAVIVADPRAPKAQRLEAALKDGGHIDVIGWVWDSVPGGNFKIFGVPDQIWQILEEECPDSLILSAELSDDQYETIVEAASVAGCRVLAAPRGTHPGKISSHLVWHQDIPFVELTMPALKGSQLGLKRVLDLVGSGLALLALSPLFAVIAVGIKLDSAGPVFFCQERIGYGGDLFRMYKFRSMSVGADERKADLAHLNESGDARLFKIAEDPRVTKIGEVLRRWSLDELPQFWNVLNGDMSLVGPRPFFEADLHDYSDRHFHRLGAKPGLTGLWQVKGRSSVVDFEEVVRLDSEYIDRWSIWLDLKLIAQTLPAVARRRGAF